MVGRKGLSGSQQAVTYTSRRAGCRQAAEQDGQRTGGRPAGRPLARHSAAQRLSSTLHNAGLIASVTLLPRLADHAATRGCPDHAHEWATITSPWISSGLTIRPEQARQFPRRRLGPFHADSNSWPAIPISRV